MIVKGEWVEIQEEVAVGYLNVTIPESPTEPGESRIKPSMGMTLNETGKITNMGLQAYQYTSLVRMVVVSLYEPCVLIQDGRTSTLQMLHFI
jgi:hypothetical protein